MENNFQKILVVNVNWMGDIVFSSPVFKALHDQYPDARITCLAVPGVKKIAELIPYVTDVIEFDEPRLKRNWLALAGFVLRLRAQHFDAVFFLHRSRTRALLMRLAGIPVRVGYDGKGRSKVLTHVVPDLDRPVHRSEIYFHVIRQFGIPVEDVTNRLTVPIRDQDDVASLLDENGIGRDQFFAAVHAGANWNLKQWPEENFAHLADRLIAEHRIPVVFIGSSKDKEKISRIVSRMRQTPCVLAGGTTLTQLVALLARANCLVSADSGPLHVANAVGTSVVAIFGPTRPEITGPRGTGEKIVLQYDVGCNREACYELNCPENLCMQAVCVEDVIHAVRQIQNS